MTLSYRKAHRCAAQSQSLVFDALQCDRRDVWAAGVVWICGAFGEDAFKRHASTDENSITVTGREVAMDIPDQQPRRAAMNTKAGDGLLAILQVPENKRVRCQAPDCKRPICKSIHVVRLRGVVTVYGSRCFEIHFQGHPIASEVPYYSSVSGKKLSDEERALLDSNTELLLQRLAQEHANNLAARSRLLDQRTPAEPPWTPPKTMATQANQAAQAEMEVMADPVLRELVQARKRGRTRAQMLAAKGVVIGHPDFFSYSLLLAKAGFEF